MRVLLATDGSKDANSATEWLTGNLLPADATLLALTVATLPAPPIDAQTMKDLRDAILADARRVGEAARALLARRWPSAEVRVSEGDPREEIVRTAEEWGADLVVVGARGLGTVKGFFLGSVSLAVGRYATCPVLVVKGRPRELKSALVAIDGSEDSLHALQVFASFALEEMPRVRLLSVLEALRVPSSAPRFIRAKLRGAVAQLQQEGRAKAEAVLERAAASLEGKAGAIERSIFVGIPADAIVQAANRDGIDLVVVGARGLGGLERLLLGSVSEKVLRAARCSVLIVKRPR